MRPDRMLRAFIGLLLVGNVYLASRVYLNHDVAWSLTAAGRMMQGAKLYDDLLELNPPLFIVLAMPAAWAAQRTGAPGPLLLLVFVHLLTLVSLWLSAWIVRRVDLPGRFGADALLGLLAFLLVPIALPLYGQREHLFTLFWTPYALAAVLRVAGRPIPAARAVFVGAWAGIGISLKPFFVLPWLAVEAYVAFRRGTARPRPEALAAAAAGAVYLLSVLALWPAYFVTIVPLARTTYWAYATPLTDVLTGIPALVAVGALVVGGLAPLRAAAWRDLRAVLWVSTAGSLLAALVQSKGWNYHLYPSIVAASLLLLVAALVLVTERAAVPALPRLLAWALPAILTVASVVAWGAGLNRLESMNRQAVRLLPVFRDCGGQGSVAFLSTDIDPAFPAVTYSGLQWTFRYAALWPLPAIVRWRDPAWAGRVGSTDERLKATEEFFVESVVGDLEEKRPDVLVVDKRRNKQALRGLAFDFVDYFARGGGFPSRGERFQRFFAEYRLVDQIASHDIYRRTTGARCGDKAALGR